MDIAHHKFIKVLNRMKEPSNLDGITRSYILAEHPKELVIFTKLLSQESNKVKIAC